MALEWAWQHTNPVVSPVLISFPVLQANGLRQLDPVPERVKKSEYISHSKL